MPGNILPLLPMIALLVWAAIEDLRVRRIRNWLTLSLMASGLLLSATGMLPITPSQSGLGLLVGFGIPLVLFILGAVGAGDVKLLAGVGAWVGPTAIVQIFLAEAVIGLFIVLVQCALQGKLFALFRNSAVLTMTILHMGQLGVKSVAETGQTCRTVDRPLPYAVPVLVATLIVVTFV